MLKWIGIGFVVIIGIAIATGYTGGASKATNNYGSVMRGGWEIIPFLFYFMTITPLYKPFH